MKYCQQLKALSDPKRVEIIQYIFQHNGLCVCELSPMVDMPQSKLSYHLKILLDAHLLSREEIGTANLYRVNEEEMKALLSEKTFHYICDCRGGGDVSKECCEKCGKHFDECVKCEKCGKCCCEECCEQCEC